MNACKCNCAGKPYYHVAPDNVFHAYAKNIAMLRMASKGHLSTLSLVSCAYERE